MAWTVCVVLYKKEDSSTWNFTVQTLLFKIPSFRLTISSYWTSSVEHLKATERHAGDPEGGGAILKVLEGGGAIRPSKGLNHHNQWLCTIFLAGVNLMVQTYGVLL